MWACTDSCSLAQQHIQIRFRTTLNKFFSFIFSSSVKSQVCSVSNGCRHACMQDECVNTRNGVVNWQRVLLPIESMLKTPLPDSNISILLGTATLSPLMPCMIPRLVCSLMVHLKSLLCCVGY